MESNLLNLLNLSPNPIFQCDENGKLLFWNNSAKNYISEFTTDGFLTNKLLESVSFLKPINNPIEIELNGRLFFLSVLKDQENKVFNLYATEVSLLKKKEKELQEQKVFFKEVFDQIPADLVVLSSEHKYLYINPKAIGNQEVRNWLIGKDDFQYVSHRNLPVEIAQKRREVFNKVVSERKILEWEEIKEIEGKTETILRRMFPVFDDENQLKFVIGYALDITAIKETELQLTKVLNRLDLVIKASNDGFWDWDLNKNTHYFSPRLKEMLGSENEIDQEISAFLTGKELDRFKKLIKKLQTQQVSDFEEIFTISKPNTRQKKFLKIRAICLQGKNQKITRIVGSVSDVTKQINYQEVLKKAKKKAEEGTKIKTNFLSTMSHEIRTPLNAVIGLTNILQAQEHLPSQTKHLKSLKLSAKNLMALVNDVLDWNKIESGNLVFEKTEINLKKLLEEIKGTYLHQAQDKNIKLLCTIDEEIPKVLVGDFTRLTQIFNNLVSNALKFTHQGKVIVHIKALKSAIGFQKVNISVSDTGIGIEKTKFKEILKAFAQASSDITRKFGGSGLGLSITNKLISLQGGKLKIKSELGKGSVFEFDIVFELPKNSQSPKSANDVTLFKIDLNKVNVLLVEDNLLNVVVAKTIIENFGPKVTVAENGVEALAAFDKAKFDLILMDLHMPIMDGYTATKKIRELDKNIPIIALTASAFANAKNKVLKTGMNDFITKPFDPVRLKQIMVENLEKSKA